MIDVAQQASWLTASIRLPQYGQVSFSDSILNWTGVGRFEILTLPLDQIHETEIEDACWLPLFLGTVVARNYPVPERQGEKGLELPFDLMTSVTGIMVPEYHDGGIYLKGHSRLLFPASGSIPGSVQWHLLTSSSRRVSLPDDLICHQTWWKVLDHRLLSNEARTFLGYCREVIVDLGTDKTTEYHKEIRFSIAEDVGQGPRIQAPTSFTWGSAGMGIFGATATHTIIWGKGLAQTVAGSNHDYLDVLDIAEKTPIILYDDSEGSHQGWMVPMLRVFLHMVHTWAAYKNLVPSGLPRASTISQAEDNARSVLERQWNFVVRGSPDEKMSKKMTVKDLVMQFWHSIQDRRNEELHAWCQSEPGVNLTPSRLYGWDYMDLITGVSSLKKQLNFSGNWIDFTKDVLVLFGGRFGQVIKPAPGISICAEWNPIPPNKMYLTATVDCLQQLSRKHGGPAHCLTSSKLTDQHYWNYRSDRLFHDCIDCCSSTSAQPVNCLKMPQTLDSGVHKSNAELSAPPNGAIVFGCRTQKKSRLTFGEMKMMIIHRTITPVHRFQNREPRSQLSDYSHEEVEEATPHNRSFRHPDPV